MRISKLLMSICLCLMSLSVYAADGVESTPDGKAVFDAACEKCHTGGFGGFFSGAPDVEDKDDWVALTPKGVDGLTGTTIAGIGKMAARGGCTTCSDAEIRAAVEYMLNASR